MAISADILIAEEITTALNGQSFSLPFTAERLYVADWDIKEELSSLQLGIWPAESSAELWERDELLKSYRIGLSFAQKVAAATRDDLDALCDLVTEVQQFLELKTVVLGNGRSFVNEGWEYVVRFAETRLDRNKGADGTVKYTGLFASVLVFDYQAED